MAVNQHPSARTLVERGRLASVFLRGELPGEGCLLLCAGLKALGAVAEFPLQLSSSDAAANEADWEKLLAAFRPFVVQRWPPREEEE